MNKEELIAKYKEVDKIRGELVIDMYNMISEIYEDKIRVSESLEELDDIFNEIQTEWPNTISTYLMYKIIYERREEIDGEIKF